MSPNCAHPQIMRTYIAEDATLTAPANLVLCAANVSVPSYCHAGRHCRLDSNCQRRVPDQSRIAEIKSIKFRMPHDGGNMEVNMLIR